MPDHHLIWKYKMQNIDSQMREKTYWLDLEAKTPLTSESTSHYCSSVKKKKIMVAASHWQCTSSCFWCGCFVRRVTLLSLPLYSLNRALYHLFPELMNFFKQLKSKMKILNLIKEQCSKVSTKNASLSRKDMIVVCSAATGDYFERTILL